MDILVATHAQMAEGLISGLNFISGENEHIYFVELDEKGIGDFRERLAKMIAKLSLHGPLLLLTDLKGGTPYNEAYAYFLAHPDDVGVVSGVNLPMLLEIAPQLDALDNINDAEQFVVSAGTSGIQVAEDEADDEADEIEF